MLKIECLELEVKWEIVSTFSKQDLSNGFWVWFPEIYAQSYLLYKSIKICNKEKFCTTFKTDQTLYVLWIEPKATYFL